MMNELNKENLENVSGGEGIKIWYEDGVILEAKGCVTYVVYMKFKVQMDNGEILDCTANPSTCNGYKLKPGARVSVKMPLNFINKIIG